MLFRSVFRDLGGYGLLAVLPFWLVLVVGLVYQWLKGGLEWR